MLDGDTAVSEDLGVRTSNLIMGPDSVINVKHIGPVEDNTWAQVDGNLHIDPTRTIFVDSITPHIHC
jgi:hypothetical protein